MSTRDTLAEAIANRLVTMDELSLPSPGALADAVMEAAHNMTIEDQATLVGGSRSQKLYPNPDGTTGRVIWVTR